MFGLEFKDGVSSFRKACLFTCINFWNEFLFSTNQFRAILLVSAIFNKQVLSYLFEGNRDLQEDAATEFCQCLQSDWKGIIYISQLAGIIFCCVQLVRKEFAAIQNVFTDLYQLISSWHKLPHFMIQFILEFRFSKFISQILILCTQKFTKALTQNQHKIYVIFTEDCSIKHKGRYS